MKKMEEKTQTEGLGFDVDDIILNMLGAIIGYGIWKLKPVQKLLTDENR